MLGSISLLLVDDNSSFLSIATRFLDGHEGVAVVGTARGGEEALTQAQALRPQVVLMDLGMPGMNGLEAISRLRDILPDAGIIALTLLDTDAYRQAALDTGADDFVPKATLSTDLLPAIRKAAQIRSSGQVSESGYVGPE